MIDPKEFFADKAELAAGAIFGLACIFFVGWWTLLSVPLCMLFFRLGGVKGGDRWFRKMGVPTTIAATLWLSTQSVWSFPTFVIMWIPLSLGYGIPDKNTGDEGSKLGAFFFKIFNENEFLASIATRSVIGLFCGLTVYPMALVDPVFGTLAALFIFIGFPTISILF